MSAELTAHDDYQFPLTVWADWELVRLIKARDPKSDEAEAILAERTESRHTRQRIIRPVEERLAMHR